ncbi:type VI secretion system baseplate subunit TssK [Rugamonas rubra]|uniref:Type VI secretion system protein ImpJ n=1 Tax=Rugamonas rubra TaxID=758825 RepID=A0A1I4JD00_9BURK|nr:type VI secretion system baseplate subunit TssK [Rugamonas rubra]SFL64127.1 type VI secretion system protein ImpJ [Rugamonas rubra]
MKTPPKVLWTEGLTLRAQLFQRQDQYHEARLHRIMKSLHVNGWGICALDWNEAALLDNSLQATSMSIIFQDGEVYDAPGSDALPAPFDLSRLPLTEESFTFYAALPLLKLHGSNLYDAGQAHGVARFAKTKHDTPDLYGGAADVPVVYLQKQLSLLSHLEPRESFVSVPVTRLRRLSRGGFEIDPSFVPPSMSINAASRLPLMLDGLMAKLKAKIDALYCVHGEPRKDVVEVQAGDISSFLMLLTISSAYAELDHYCRAPAQHPEHLFVALLGLAGGLGAFSRKFAHADFPQYKHAEPGPAFLQLDQIVRELIDIVISSKYFLIPLEIECRGRANYHGKLTDERIDRDTLLCFAVKADMPGVELVRAVPKLFKVGSPDDVENLVGYALSGIKLVHMPQVPIGIPVRPNTYYFSLETKSDLYEKMMKAQEIAIYVPDMFPDLQLFPELQFELIALLA